METEKENGQLKKDNGQSPSLEERDNGQNCLNCDKVLEISKTKPSKFCSDACRKAVSRQKTEEEKAELGEVEEFMPNWKRNEKYKNRREALEHLFKIAMGIPNHEFQFLRYKIDLHKYAKIEKAKHQAKTDF